MKAYVITIKGHPTSEAGLQTLLSSSASVKNEFPIERWDAVTPDTVALEMDHHNLKWNYPTHGSVLDPWTGMRKTSYGERDLRRRMACSMSHFKLWSACADQSLPFLILEHDAMFVQHFDPRDAIGSRFGAVGINDPYLATFGWNKYHSAIQSRQDSLQPAPMIAGKEIPQGLAGNSAYVVKPEAAAALVDLCYKYGLWPNDAIMCQQLYGGIGVSRTYYTTIQHLPSTTTL